MGALYAHHDPLEPAFSHQRKVFLDAENIIATHLDKPHHILPNIPFEQLLTKHPHPVPGSKVIIGQPDKPSTKLIVDVLHLISYPCRCLDPPFATPVPPLGTESTLMRTAPTSLDKRVLCASSPQRREVVFVDILPDQVVTRKW